jgi:hypothetical protein
VKQIPKLNDRLQESKSVSDDLFQYFNKSSSRKFEPIDDPDFDALDDEPTVASNPTGDPPTPVEEPTLVTASTSLTGNTPDRDVISESNDVDPSETEPPAKKGESHWDFLAGLLGIKKSNPPPAEKKVVVEKAPPRVEPSKTVQAPKVAPPAPPTADPLQEIFRPDLPLEKIDLFEETKSESPRSGLWETKDRTTDPLSELFDDQRQEERFAPLAAQPNHVDWEEEEEEEEEGEEDQDDTELSEDTEFLEFEIEEWDSVQSETRTGSRRRPSREPEAEDQPQKQDREPAGPRGRRNDRSRRSDSRQSDSRQSDSRQSDSRQSDSRQRDSRSDRGRGDREARRVAADPSTRRSDARPHPPARGGSHPPAPVSAARSDFGAGLFEDEPSSEARFEPSQFEPSQTDSKSRRRRRRRGGRSSAESSGERLEEVKGFAPEIEIDPPDDFFDEIGWNAQPASASLSDRDRRSEEIDDFDEDEIFSSRSETMSDDDSEDGEREPRKRKRKRRRGKKDRDKEPASVTPIADLSDDDDFLDEIPVFDDLPSRTDEAKSSRNHRKRKDDESRRGPSSGSGRDSSHGSSKDARRGSQQRSQPELEDDFDGDDSEDGKKAKFPTWDEAISGLVQSNIKNHSRQNRGGRSSGGGRRQR